MCGAITKNMYVLISSISGIANVKITVYYGLQVVVLKNITFRRF